MKKILLILATGCSLLYSHSGRTDASGCHNNRKNGTYHCHGTKEYSAVKPTKKNISIDTVITKAEYKCGEKWKCSQMNACSEAYFHMETCGLDKLDGDKDGVPCERLCR